MRLPFNGTGISVIGTQDSCSGQASRCKWTATFRHWMRIGRPAGGWQQALYTVTGLPAGSHALTLTVLGTKQSASCGAWIYIDAI